MALRTPLYDWHVSHGARMVDFAGWDMPVQYTGIVEEHVAVRSNAGLFDISHMGRLSFGGPDALELIQQVYSNNAATMKDFQVRYGLICNDAGGVRDDVLVYRWPYGWAMVVNASNRDKIIGWLNEHQSSRNVQLRDQTQETCMIAVQGPRAVELCHGLTEADAGVLPYYFAAATRCMGQNCVVSRTGYTGEDGLEIMIGAAQGVAVWEELIRRGAMPCGLGARDTLRLEAGMPLYGHELTEEINPIQAGLDWAVKLNKGDFIGRDALVAAQGRNDPAGRQRVGLVLEGRRAARADCRVTNRDGSAIGTITSGCFTPTLGKAIAMGYLESRHAAVGTVVQIDVRGKPEAAQVVSLPFYRRPKPA